MDREIASLLLSVLLSRNSNVTSEIIWPTIAIPQRCLFEHTLCLDLHFRAIQHQCQAPRRDLESRWANNLKRRDQFQIDFFMSVLFKCDFRNYLTNNCHSSVAYSNILSVLICTSEPFSSTTRLPVEIWNPGGLIIWKRRDQIQIWIFRNTIIIFRYGSYWKLIQSIF